MRGVSQNFVGDVLGTLRCQQRGLAAASDFDRFFFRFLVITVPASLVDCRDTLHSFLDRVLTPSTLQINFAPGTLFPPAVMTLDQAQWILSSIRGFQTSVPLNLKASTIRDHLRDGSAVFELRPNICTSHGHGCYVLIPERNM